MRRISAILLLIAFSFALVAAPFAGSESNVPACCRRGGKHHCRMGADDASTDRAPGVKARVCPYFPTIGAMSAPVGIGLAAAPQGIPAFGGYRAAAVVRGEKLLPFSPEKSHQKRGPPFLLLLS